MANLNEMTNEQREQYRVSICVVLGLDPNPALGNLDYAWMPQENGMKNLVLYARRGVTEQLREINGVNILSLEQWDGPGYVSFKVTAVNKKGRQEIAVGAHETEGLKGKRLADAIATAQTRALRRVTLQFTGFGVLDESEVNIQIVSSTPSPASLAEPAGSLAVIPPPTTAPSEAPGKDITVPRELPPPVADMASHIEKVYADGAKALADMKPAKMVTTLVPEPMQVKRIQTTVFPPNAVQNIPQTSDIKADTVKEEFSPPVVVDGVVVQSCNTGLAADIKPDTEPPKRRGRRPGSRNRVNIQSPGQQTEMPVGQIDAQGKITPIDAVAEHEKGSMTIAKIAEAVLPQAHTEYHVPLPPHVGTTVVIVPDPALQNVMQPIKVDMAPAVVPVLPKEKQEEYRNRLSKYYNDILPKGGMSSSEGIGGPTMKTRKFAAIHTGVADTKLMTEQHWNDLFEFLDANATNPKFLVEYINKALGVA